MGRAAIGDELIASNAKPEITINPSNTSDSMWDASETAAVTHPGWAASGAVQECQQAWSRHLVDLVEINDSGEKIHAAGVNVQQADLEEAWRLHELLDQLSH